MNTLGTPEGGIFGFHITERHVVNVNKKNLYGEGLKTWNVNPFSLSRASLIGIVADSGFFWLQNSRKLVCSGPYFSK